MTTGRDIALVLRDWGQRHLGVTCVTHVTRNASGHQMVLSDTPLRTCLTSPPNTPHARWQSGDREEVPGSRQVAPSNVIVQGTRAAKGGESSGLQLLSAATTTVTTRKRTAPTRSTSRPLNVASSDRRNHRQTLQETPQGGLSEPYMPRQAQDQGMRHDEKFHDLRGRARSPKETWVERV
jgi:hypothetical protein